MQSNITAMTEPHGEALLHTTPLARMLALCTTHPFVQVDLVLFDLCTRLKLACTGEQPIGYCTWRPVGSHFVTLIKHNGITLLYCHYNDVVYYTQPCVRLQNTCPDGTAILGQFCEDNVDGQLHPRLLMFDVLSTSDPCYKSRGVLLRDLVVHLPRPLCALQWSGEASSLRSFIGNLPHKVDCLLELGNEASVLQCHSVDYSTPRSAMQDIIADIMSKL